MKKLYSIIDKWFNEGKKPGFCTPADMYALTFVYNDLVKNHKAEFIAENVKRVLTACGIKTAACGIGWKAVKGA